MTSDISAKSPRLLYDAELLAHIGTAATLTQTLPRGGKLHSSWEARWGELRDEALRRMNPAHLVLQLVAPDLAEQVATLTAQLAAVTAERDEADRRAGAAERRNEFLQDSVSRRADWLARAKDAEGFSQNGSFDELWAKVRSERDEAVAALQRMQTTATPSKKEPNT